jgi:prepilin-type processing-associated H-X9-DG protein
VFAQAREKARTASCQSNLKQVGLALHMYVTDYDGMGPLWGCNQEPQGRDTGPWTRLQPYIKNEQLYTCPSRPDLRWKRCGSVPSGWTAGGGYGFNFVAVADRGWAAPDATFRWPAETILAADSDGQTFLNNPFCNFCQGDANLQPRHNGGANVAFLDGHVKWSQMGFLLPGWQPGRSGYWRGVYQIPPDPDYLWRLWVGR